VNPTVSLTVGAHTLTLTVTDDAGATASDTVVMTVSSAVVPPSITAQPQNQTASVGQTATFSVTGAGTAPLSYQWQKNGVALPSATGSSYTTPPTTLTDNGVKFRVVVSNAAGSITSVEAVLTVTSANQLPLANAGADQTVQDANGDGVESVTLDGSVSRDPDGAIVNYSWGENGVEIATGVNPTVSLTVGAHTLTLTVTDDAGATASDTVVIIVTVAPAGAALLFQSDFESGVMLEPPFVEGDQWWQRIKGADIGHDWSTNLPDRGDSRFQYLVPAAKNLSDYVETRIDRITGPHGVPTNTLFMAVKTYDPNRFGRGWLTRNQYNLLWDASIKQAYSRYWLKLQPDLETLMPPGESSWRNVIEWRESGEPQDDFRWSLLILRNPQVNRLFWVVEAEDIIPRRQVVWRIENTTVPVPIGEWFRVEVFWRHSLGDDGRIWIAIDGQTIADYKGPTQKDSDLSKWNPFKVYTGTNSLDTGMAYQWIDGFEIHTDIPPPSVNRPPVAQAGADQTVMDTDGDGVESVTLNGAGSSDPDGTIINYSWMEKGVEIATGVKPSVSLGVGTHTITLTVIDDDGTTASDTVVITVKPSPPTIARQPQDQTVTIGQTATFTVTGAGTVPLSYQWQKNGVALPGATALSFTTPPTTLADNGTKFRVVVSNVAGSVTSREAILMVNQPPLASAGVDGTVQETDGDGVESVTLDGSGSLDPDGAIVNYSWSENGVEIATGVQPSVSLAVGSHTMTLTITDDDGATARDTVVITVTLTVVPPRITTQPIDQRVPVGRTATLSVEVTGTGPLSYQWQKNGVDLPGATSSTYTTPPVSLSESGATFRVVATNATGSAISREAVLTVTPAEFPLFVPQGIGLIHIPLKVTGVDGRAMEIQTLGDVYDVLGGAENVNFIVTYQPPQGDRPGTWRSYLGDMSRGSLADEAIRDDLGIITVMRHAVTRRLKGDALGTGGVSQIRLHRGINLMGLPLKDSRVQRVSDLLSLEGIQGNAIAIIVFDGSRFKVVARPGDEGDIPVTGGQAFVITANQTGVAEIRGEAWHRALDNVAAAPRPLILADSDERTPVLPVYGTVVDETTGMAKAGFRATIKNLSTGVTLTALSGSDQPSTPPYYSVTFVDLTASRVARVGDLLEITAQPLDNGLSWTARPNIGVQPLRHTVSTDEIRAGRIHLPPLVAYEIPTKTELLENYPNPLNPETWIPYRLAEEAFVILTLYDLTGRVVRTIEVGFKPAASFASKTRAIYWDGRNDFGERVASGIYFYTLTAKSATEGSPPYVATRKMLLLK